MGTLPSGYQTPKTDWAVGNIPVASDFNRVEGNSKAIEEGSRTIDPAKAPASNVGTLRNFLDWFANRIRAITGGTNWWDAPAATIASLLSSLNSHIGLTTTAHGGITPSTHIGSGGSSHAAATTSANGFMSAADKTKLNGIEAGATADQTAAEILTALKTVDGTGSGLDADYLRNKSPYDIFSFFGDGSDGNITISSNTTLSRDMFYNNLTINSGITLYTNGYRIFVKGTLTNNGTIAANGNNASGSTGGTGSNNNYLSGGSGGGDGTHDKSGNNGSPATFAIGGMGGTGGSGGNTPGAGGAVTAPSPIWNIKPFLALAGILDRNGLHTLAGGSGGGSGGAQPAQTAGDGYSGGGGGGGGVVFLVANILANNGTISAKGGNGGNAVPSSGYQSALGGGGGGGGGGIILIYASKTATGSLSVAGGTGGTGLSGGGTGNTGSTGHVYEIAI